MDMKLSAGGYGVVLGGKVGHGRAVNRCTGGGDHHHLLSSLQRWRKEG